MRSREAIDRAEGDSPRENYLVDVRLALLYFFDEFLQAFPFLGVHILELHPEVLPG